MLILKSGTMNVSDNEYMLKFVVNIYERKKINYNYVAIIYFN